MIEITARDIAHGGEAVGRHDGKAVFVAGVIPGETVTAEVVREKKGWARAQLVDIVEPSPLRISPRCPHFGECGGCQWQFVERSIQAHWMREVVSGQLMHLGKLGQVDVREAMTPGPAFGYRNRMDFGVAGGRPALRQARSHTEVALSVCHLLHPLLVPLFNGLGDLEGVEAITIRGGVGTGELMAVVSGRVPDQAASWSNDLGVNVVARRRGVSRPVQGHPSVTEVVGGHRFRITGSGFFQNNTNGAEALVELVKAAADVRADEVLLDGFAGVGLFAVTVGVAASEVIAVERAGETADDLRFNLEVDGHDPTGVLAGSFEELPANLRWDVAVVDPPRSGLGTRGIEVVARPSPRTIVYVSCDPASLARDSLLLKEQGYTLDYVTPVDMFPQTFHIECVARFSPA